MKWAINHWCLKAKPVFLVDRCSSSVTEYQHRNSSQQGWAERSARLKDKHLHLGRASHEFPWKHNMSKLGIEKVWFRPYSKIHLPPKGTICISTFRVSIMPKKLNSFQSHSEKGTLFLNRATSWGLWCNCWRNLGRRDQGQEQESCWDLSVVNRGHIWTQNLSNRIPKFNFAAHLSCYGIKKKKPKRQNPPKPNRLTALSLSYLYFYGVIAVEVDGSHPRYIKWVCAVQQQQQAQNTSQPFLQKGEGTVKHNRNTGTELEIGNNTGNVHLRHQRGCAARWLNRN